MSKKQKMILRLSIGINLLLIALVVWGFIKVNFAKEQVFITEVQENLVELEGLIANQSEKNWPNPNLVTTELGDVLNGIWLGITTGDQLGILSKEDKNTLKRLYSKLNQYPKDELYQFTELTEEDKRNFEQLREVLRDAGLGLNMQISNNYHSFIVKAEGLAEKIESSLN